MSLDWKVCEGARGQEVWRCRRDDGSIWFEIHELPAGGYRVAWWRKVEDVDSCCLTWTVRGTLAAARALAGEKVRDGAE